MSKMMTYGEAIREAALLLGGTGMLENIRRGDISLYQNKTMIAVWRPEELCLEIEKTDAKTIAVLMSGDSGFNSGTTHLLSEMKKTGLTEKTEVKVLPGVGYDIRRQIAKAFLA